MTALFDIATPAPAPAGAARPLVIGLDLSLTSTGIARADGTTLTVKTRKGDGDARLHDIRFAVILAATREVDAGGPPPTLAVLEDLPTHAKGSGITGMVHGVVRAALIELGIPYALVVPATLKSYACDDGRADKPEMAAAAYLAAGREFPGDLTPAGKGGDQCDAWWLRAAGLDWLGCPEFTLPQAQRNRLAKAKWPAAVTP